MTDYVFLGPTLAVSEAREILPAEYLPPAARGDVYRVGLRQPRAIGIIDGYFRDQPSILHKEILWALSRGIRVYGSASMGALRAAELAAFGMRGIGWIFTAYCAGELTDDDEVAVVHAPEELQYQQLSVALVNIRRTMEAAYDAGVIDAAECRNCTIIAKRMFYADRTYQKLLDNIEKAGLACLGRLRDWISLSNVDQKLLDARQMLEVMRRELTANGCSTARTTTRFVSTVFWERFVREYASEQSLSLPKVDIEMVLEELRLLPKEYARAFDAALLRELALNIPASRKPHAVASTCDVNEGRLAELRVNYGTEANKIDLLKLACEEEWATEIMAHFAAGAEGRLINYIITSGQYHRLLRRAKDKRSRLESGQADYAPDEAKGVVNAHFEQTGVVPENLERWARLLGFRDELQLVNALVREARYKRVIQTGSLSTDMPESRSPKVGGE
jgi:hypothetical protein